MDNGQGLELLCHRANGQTAGARRIAEHGIYLFIQHQTPKFCHLLVWATGLVNLDHLHRHPPYAAVFVPFVYQPFCGVFTRDAKNGRRAGEEVHKAELQLLGGPFWWCCVGHGTEYAHYKPQGEQTYPPAWMDRLVSMHSRPPSLCGLHDAHAFDLIACPAGVPIYSVVGLPCSIEESVSKEK